MYRMSWWKVITMLLVVAFAFWHPVTRRIVWAILPLGTKPDDLIVIAIFIGVIALILAVIRGAVHNSLVSRIIASLFLSEKRKNDELSNPHEIDA